MKETRTPIASELHEQHYVTNYGKSANEGHVVVEKYDYAPGCRKATPWYCSEHML